MDLLAELRHRKVLAIIRADGPDRAVDCIHTLVERRHHRPRGLAHHPRRRARRSRRRAPTSTPSVLIGAGTVVTPAQADEVAAARRRASSSPPPSPKAPTAASTSACRLLCGALTPTEVVAALDLGAPRSRSSPPRSTAPATSANSARPSPTHRSSPSAASTPPSAPEYLAAGALAVGVGSPLLGDAGTGGSQTELADRAARPSGGDQRCLAGRPAIMGHSRRRSPLSGCAAGEHWRAAVRGSAGSARSAGSAQAAGSAGGPR